MAALGVVTGRSDGRHAFVSGSTAGETAVTWNRLTASIGMHYLITEPLRPFRSFHTSASTRYLVEYIFNYTRTSVIRTVFRAVLNGGSIRDLRRQFRLNASSAADSDGIARSYTSVFAAFDDVEKRNSLASTGADLTAVFGGAELDVRDATVDHLSARINAVALFGGVDIVLRFRRRHRSVPGTVRRRGGRRPTRRETYRVQTEVQRPLARFHRAERGSDRS